jgi:hypothetical protein
VLRPAPHKRRALVIDLCGATHIHGYPDQDREYSLTGRPISGSSGGLGQTEREPFVQNILNVDLEVAAHFPEPANAAPPRRNTARATANLAEVKRVRSKHGATAAKSTATYFARQGDHLRPR